MEFFVAIAPFPIQIKGNDLLFGKESIPLKYWEGFWITKTKTYRIELFCHRNAENKWYKTVLRIHCETEQIWQQCITTLSQTQLTSGVKGKYEIESYEHTREYNLTKDGIYEIYKSITLPVMISEIVHWIEDPVSMIGKQAEKCGAYLKEQIKRACTKKDNSKLKDLMSSAATIPGFNFLELLSPGQKNSPPPQDSKS